MDKKILVVTNLIELVEDKREENVRPRTERSCVETRGLVRLFLCAGWGFEGGLATSGSNSHDETRSGRTSDDGSSH